MSKPPAAGSRREGERSLPVDDAGTRAASRASSGTTHGDTDVANDLPRNGPSGWYSHDWMSRADQSFTRHTPKTCSANASVGTGSPGCDGRPTTQPTSTSTSSRALGPNSGPGP